jgi:hypothetical protein
MYNIAADIKKTKKLRILKAEVKLWHFILIAIYEHRQIVRNNSWELI